jgi:hypothetical protein
VERKLAIRLVLGALAGTLACGGSAVGPPPSTPRIDYVDGAIEPLLVRGQAVVLEGFGFGDVQGSGTIHFARIGGGVVPAAVTAGGWSDRAVQTVVPDSAATGPLVLSTADGRSLPTTVHVLPRVAFDPTTLAWQPRSPFQRGPPVGVALAAGVEPAGSALNVIVYAAGGAEPLSGDSAFLADSAVSISRVGPGGAIGTWKRDSATRDLPARRAFAALAVANRFNSRFKGRAVYVIGGIDAAGRARATVFQSLATADTVLRPFTPIEPLPVPVSGAIAVVRRGRIYVVGGADSLGRPQPNVFIGRIGVSGDIDGWYVQPALPAPRAYGGGVVLDTRVAVFGGISDSAPPGGGLDTLLPRLAAGEGAPVSPVSGFFTGAWSPGVPTLPAGRSQFATLTLGNVVLLVGGIYAAASTNAVETLAGQVIGGDSLGDFSGPVGTNSIAALGGGTLVGAAGVSWLDADGSPHGLVVGGIDLITRERRDGTWGF